MRLERLAISAALAGDDQASRRADSTHSAARQGALCSGDSFLCGQRSEGDLDLVTEPEECPRFGASPNATRPSLLPAMPVPGLLTERLLSQPTRNSGEARSASQCRMSRRAVASPRLDSRRRGGKRGKPASSVAGPCPPHLWTGDRRPESWHRWSRLGHPAAALITAAATHPMPSTTAAADWIELRRDAVDIERTNRGVGFARLYPDRAVASGELGLAVKVAW